MHGHARRRIAVAAILGTVALAATSASTMLGAPQDSGRQTAAQSASSGLTWWVFYRPLLSLDPVKFEDYPENTILGNLCESLLTVTPTFKVVPDLASKVDGSNPARWVITIRSGVHFWDGSPLTAADVVYSLKRNFVPTAASVYGATFMREVKSVTQTGANQVTIGLKAPDVSFPSRLVTAATAVISKRFAMKRGDALGTPKGGIMCTGPYKVASWDGSTKITIVRNAGYWNRTRMPTVPKITFVWPQDTTTIANSFSSGAFDGGFNLPPASALRLKSSSAGTLQVGKPEQTLTAEVLAIINTAGSAVADTRVRKALDLAIDRKSLAASAFDGLAFPIYTLAPPGTWGYGRSLFSAAYARAEHDQDMKRAKDLVKQAGAIAKKPIVVATPGGQPISIDQMSIIQQNAKAIGLDFRIKPIPPDQYGALFSDPKTRRGINALLTIGYAHVRDPLSVYDDSLGATGIANYLGYANPTVTKLLAAAKMEQDPQRRARLVLRIQSQFLKDLPYIPLLAPLTTVFERKGLSGAPLTYTYESTPWAAMLRTK